MRDKKIKTFQTLINIPKIYSPKSLFSTGMKKIIFLAILTLILISPLITITAHAASVDEAQNILKGVGERVFGSGESDVAVIVGRVIQTVLGIIGIIFTVLIIFGGILYMTAAGNQEQVTKARTLLRDSIIGLAIIITSFAITEFIVFNILSATTA